MRRIISISRPGSLHDPGLNRSGSAAAQDLLARARQFRSPPSPRPEVRSPRSEVRSPEPAARSLKDMMRMEIWPGQPYPLGATYDGSGTNFSVFSEVAERIELCLFDESGTETRVDLPEVTGFCWHGYVPTTSPGQRY